jgi:hypothetical protein
MKYPFDSLRFWLALFLFSVYLLSFSGKFHVMDELAVFVAGNNLAQHGRADINPLLWTQHWTPHPPGVWGPDDNLYTKKAPGISWLVAPLLWLGHILPDLNAVHLGLLTNALVTALTAAFLFVWLTDLGFARLAAVLTSLSYGLGTIAWVYARMFWESSLLALAILIAVWAIYRSTRLAYARQRLFWIFLAGLAGAVGLTLRFETIPALGFITLYIIWESISWQLRQLRGTGWLRRPGRSGRQLLQTIPWGRLIIFLTPSMITGLALLLFNFSRFGNFSETGYSQELLFQAPWIGSFGLLLSPGRGLFIYAPLLLLLFWGIRPAWRRLSIAYFWLIVGLSLFYWLFYGSWFAWGGTWGWGPRFLLPILPLLMLFVAEPIEALFFGKTSQPQPGWLARLGLICLAGLSLLVNFLGIAVDFNEHFLRLGRNDNFVFNWAAFPPLAHWRLLQEGVLDVIWLRPDFSIEWSILTPALLLFGLAALGLASSLYQEWRTLALSTPWSYYRARPSLLQFRRGQEFMPGTTRYVLLFVLLPLTLIYAMMLGTARLALEQPQYQLDRPLLDTLHAAGQPGDALLIPMPPFADVQEVTTMLIAYLDQPWPITAWIESEPRAIQAAERVRVVQAAQREARRIWLFERWLVHNAPPTPTAAYLDQHAFPLAEQWFEKSGKLTLYAVADAAPATPPHPLNIPFQGGLTLLDFTLLDPIVPASAGVIRIRLSWQLATADKLAQPAGPAESLIVSVQLLDPDPARPNLAQNDRRLLDRQAIAQLPWRPGQTLPQGYGLTLPVDLAPGSYPLIVSLYQADNGQRLKRADASTDDFLYLTNVVVK